MNSIRIYDLNDIVVSVCILTYNQEKYILETLNGVFSQKINFKCEILLFDDNSTDRTVEIIQEYLKTNSSVYFTFFLNVNSSNLGVSKNFHLALSTCKGKYIAMCDGDDYWSDSNKLQKQVEFLEMNNDFFICYHNANILFNGDFKEDNLIEKKISQISTYHDLLYFGNYMQTSSVVFVNKLDQFPFELFLHLCDYIIWFWISQFGKIYRFNENMSVYRVGSGLWSGLTDVRKSIFTLNSLNEVIKITKNDSDKVIIHFRLQSLKYSLLPVELQSVNSNHYDLITYLSKKISNRAQTTDFGILIITFLGQITPYVCTTVR
jgi:glycosyltransferase involved in cell wall biosynthesis